MKTIGNVLPVVLYILGTALEWHLYLIETNCFDKGGRLAVAIMFTTPLALAIVSIMWTIVSESFRVFRAKLSQ